MAEVQVCDRKECRENLAQLNMLRKENAVQFARLTELEKQMRTRQQDGVELPLYLNCYVAWNCRDGRPRLVAKFPNRDEPFYVLKEIMQKMLEKRRESLRFELDRRYIKSV